MYSIKRLLVWILRIRYCRGFGVQSPSDYAFIRYVINEHYPYYAYSDIDDAFPSLGRRERKIGRLCFRIANFLQPDAIVLHPSSTVMPEFLKAGCAKARIVSKLADVERLRLLIFRLGCDSEELFSTALFMADDDTVLVIEGIRRDRAAKAFWRRVRSTERVGMTFDLFYVGIVFFDHKRYKQNYLVNF